MKNWKMEFTAEQTIADIKIQSSIFQEDLLSPLQFIIEMSSNYILRKCMRCYKYAKSKEVIDHIIYNDEINLLAKLYKNRDLDTKLKYTTKI